MIDSFHTIKKVHFIGIGGIGISAIARMLLLEGKTVSGSDRGISPVTADLEKHGATIFIGQDPHNIPEDCDLVIYTVAIASDNPELQEAHKRGCDVITYPQALHIISKNKYTIAVSGTHGKTTTTAMSAYVLIEAGLDPTVLVGSLMNHPDKPEEKSNFIAGTSNYFLVEADEYKKSFHNLSPKILVINNVDLDHLDFYKDLSDIQESFRHLAERVPKDGYVICDLSHPHVAPIVAGLEASIVDYIKYEQDVPKLAIPGKHNRHNAAAAYALGKVFGAEDAIIKRALERFKGTWRRFEFKGITKTGALVYDDYAHNPQKVKAALEGAREQFSDKTITVVFQPHLFSRTKLLLDTFAESFFAADNVIISPIYAAREAFDPSISSDVLAERIRLPKGKAMALPSFEKIEETVAKILVDDHHVLITMGAGDVHKLGEKLIGITAP